MSKRKSTLTTEEKMEVRRAKEEVAKEIGKSYPDDDYMGNVPSKYCGVVGGAVGGKKLSSIIKRFEEDIANKNQ